MFLVTSLSLDIYIRFYKDSTHKITARNNKPRKSLRMIPRKLPSLLRRRAAASHSPTLKDAPRAAYPAPARARIFANSYKFKKARVFARTAVYIYTYQCCLSALSSSERATAAAVALYPPVFPSNVDCCASIQGLPPPPPPLCVRA